MDTATLIDEARLELQARIEAGYDAWEAGEGASPSDADFMIFGIEVFEQMFGEKFPRHLNSDDIIRIFEATHASWIENAETPKEIAAQVVNCLSEYVIA